MNLNGKMAISAALDGECCDVEELRRALSTEEGRELLASFLLIRAQIAADDFGLQHSLSPTESRKVEKQTNGAPRTFFPRFRLGWVPVALLTALVLAFTFWTGTIWRSHEMNAKPHSEVAESQVLRPSMGPTPVRTGNAEGSITAQPPKSTRTMRYVPGTEWNSNSFLETRSAWMGK